MFQRRPIAHSTRQLKTINHWLSGLAYRGKWLLLVAIMIGLSTTQLPQMFADQVANTARVITTRTGKKYRIINLDKPATDSSTKSLKDTIIQPTTQTGVITSGSTNSGLIVSYTGTGSCIWNMESMQWTGLQTYTGDYLSGGLLSGSRSLDVGLYTGSWSGFDSQMMIVASYTGIMMHSTLANSMHYLAMRDCVWSGGLITYPTDVEYLSGLVMFTGQLQNLPTMFTGVQLVVNSGQLASATQAKSASPTQVQTSGDIRSIQSSDTLRGNAGGPRGTINPIDKGRTTVRSKTEFQKLVDSHTIKALRQITKRSRDTGAINKLQLTEDITYESDDARIKADIKTDTVIFTAQGQELRSDDMVIQKPVVARAPKDSNPPTKNPVAQDIVEFGTPGDHLIFTQPVKLVIDSDQADGTLVNVSVKHGDDVTYTKQGLSTNPNTSCDLDGNTSIPAASATVQGGQITIYTCGASIFTFTYVGGANYANFVDNGSLSKTITVATGSVTSGFVLQDLKVIIDFQAIDTENPTSFGTTNAYANEKSFTITSPQNVTRTLLATNTYSAGSANRAVVTFSDAASASPSGLPASGTFLPNQSLNSVYSGINPIGIWTLTMADSVGSDGVILHGFNVIMQQPICGDNSLDIGEQCDDGNKVNGDGCNKFCKIEVQCGDGITSPPASSTYGTLVSEDFESMGNGTLSANTTIVSTTGYSVSYENSGYPSRVRYGTDAVQNNGGGGAFTMDSSVNGIYATNYLIIQSDLSTSVYSTDLTLDFDYSDHSDEIDAEDRVWVRGSDTSPWLEIYDRGNSSTVNGTYQLVRNLDIDALLSANGQEPTSTFQVRFGQYDNYGAVTDGVSFDNIVIKGSATNGLSLAEQCDDSNKANGDGCNYSCQIEPGRQCSGTPSVCTLIPSATGLAFHLDGSIASGLFTDISGNGRNATNFNGVTTGNSNGETVMCFNGVNQYIERATNMMTAYPFTMSTWVKATSTAGTRGIMSYARSSSATIMYNIEHADTVLRQGAQNTTARYNNALTPFTTTEWFLVTAVYNSSTSREIYVNGTLDATSATSANYSSNAANRLNIGRLANNAPAGTYFSGCVDDVRLYASALTSSQVYQLYVRSATLTTALVYTGSPFLTGTISSPLDRITVTLSGKVYTGTNNGNGTWSIATGLINPSLASGSYIATLTVTNPYNRTFTYGGYLTVSLPTSSSTGTLCIYTPSTVVLTGTTANTGSVFEYQFDYFSVADSKGLNTGYYTTLSMPTLTAAGGATLPNAAIQRKGDSIVVMSGSSNPRVVIDTGMQSYKVANTTTTFIKRNTAANSNVKGQYGSKLRIKVTAPAYQQPGFYTGTVTYTLYEG